MPTWSCARMRNFCLFLTGKWIVCLSLPKMYLQCYCLIFYFTSHLARVPWWASGQMTWPSQGSYDSDRLREVMRGRLTIKNTQKTKATSASPTALLQHTQLAADVLIRHVNGPTWSRGNDTVSAFFSYSYLKVRVASVCWWGNFLFFPLCQTELGSSITRLSQTGGMGLSGGIPQIIRLIYLFMFCTMPFWLRVSWNRWLLG